MIDAFIIEYFEFEYCFFFWSNTVYIQENNGQREEYYRGGMDVISL